MTSGFSSRISINGVCFSGQSLQDDLSFCDEHGLSYLTVPMSKVDEAGPEASRSAIRRSAVTVDTTLLPSLFTLEDESVWPSETRRIIDAIDFAANIGASAIYTTTGPAGRMAWEDATNALARALRPALDYAASRDVMLLVESTPPMYAHFGFVFHLDEVVELTRRTGLGLVIDVFGVYHERHLLQTIREAAGEIRLVQVSDYVPGQLSPDNSRAVPGDGVVPLPDILRTVLDTGYGGLFDIETFGPRIEQEGASDAVLRGAQFLSGVLRGEEARRATATRALSGKAPRD
jgi:sugar phosphate isomerase/epimerase